MKELNSPMIKETALFNITVETPLPVRTRPKLEMFSDGVALRERHDVFVTSVVAFIKAMAHVRVDTDINDTRVSSEAYFDDDYKYVTTTSLVISNHNPNKPFVRTVIRIHSNVEEGVFKVRVATSGLKENEGADFIYRFKQAKEGVDYYPEQMYEPDYSVVTDRMSLFSKKVGGLTKKSVLYVCTENPTMYGMDLTRENFILMPKILKFKAYLKGENVASVFIPIYPRPDKDEHNKDEIPTFLNVENQYTYSIDDLNPFYGVLFTDPIKPIEVTKEEE